MLNRQSLANGLVCLEEQKKCIYLKPTFSVIDSTFFLSVHVDGLNFLYKTLKKIHDCIWFFHSSAFERIRKTMATLANSFFLIR